MAIKPENVNPDYAWQCLDAANVLISILDSKGDVIFINKKGLQVYGYEIDDLVGKNLFDLVLPEFYREEVRAAYLKVVSGELNFLSSKRLGEEFK